MRYSGSRPYLRAWPSSAGPPAAGTHAAQCSEHARRRRLPCCCRSAAASAGDSHRPVGSARSARRTRLPCRRCLSIVSNNIYTQYLYIHNTFVHRIFRIDLYLQLFHDEDCTASVDTFGTHGIVAYIQLHQ